MTYCIFIILTIAKLKVSGPCVETLCFLLFKNIINVEMWA